MPTTEVLQVGLASSPRAMDGLVWLICCCKLLSKTFWCKFAILFPARSWSCRWASSFGQCCRCRSASSATWTTSSLGEMVVVHGSLVSATSDQILVRLLQTHMSPRSPLGSCEVAWVHGLQVKTLPNFVGPATAKLLCVVILVGGIDVASYTSQHRLSVKALVCLSQ
jgi:hypothetical protein